ncbi:hypothetical protein QCN29_11560 [Streptomyces sp. HNM0663]|uniref:Uncharacterized protein n=1 Tax=Streptomyces chengmaiensis TaxID=3040919 RepID=A0ABT6HNE0_9ACTN|nr:hypothetical protein [Streptomyces chengmaiensis]MDH2389419.1 hypothetical protein [Streptomyces chengmaiensis]
MEDQPFRLTQLPLDDLAAAFVQAGETLFLAIHDDISARVRLAHPEAEYLEVSVDADGDVELHGIWSAQESGLGSCRLLYDPHGDAEEDWRDGPLDVDELISDLGRVLSSSFLYHWGVVEPHPVHEYRDRRWISLPPADRAAAVADIVRRHVPDAVSLICRFEARDRGIAVGFEKITLSSGETVPIPCPRCSPDTEDSPWPHDVSHELAHPLGQLYALPHLRSRHLTPCMDLASEHEGQMWQLVFPYPS